MPVNDRYRLKLSGNMSGQTIVNIFYYRNTTNDGFAADIGGTFQNSFLPVIVQALSNAVTYTDIEVLNLDNSADYWSNAFSFSGTRIGEYFNSFVAYGFLSFPTTSNYKAGGKRFPGVSEADTTNGIPSGAQLIRLDNIATILGQVVNVGGKVFRPQFFSRKCVKDPVTHKCTDVFTESFGTIGTYAWKWITTQNSRKLGVGI